MLWKEIKRYWMSGFIVISLALILSAVGCRDAFQDEMQNADYDGAEEYNTLQNIEDIDEILEVCCRIYEQMETNSTSSDLEMIRGIVNQIGEQGYAAIDSENQINMTEPEQVIEFCERVNEHEEASLVIADIIDRKEFTIITLRTEKGSVKVEKKDYEYNNGTVRQVRAFSYLTTNFLYTEDGYLMFSGEVYQEEIYMLTLGGIEDHTALRVQPIEETCRELNRKYLSEIGYEQNNMFLINWRENDFGELDFYDLYDVCYKMVYDCPVPYLPDDDLAVGAVYHIPENDFEQIIKQYVNVDSETLHTNTNYNRENRTYEYKPRGFYEREYPEYPYSEVVDYTENKDGTITLLVHVVYPYMDNSNVFTHQVVVHPYKDGRFSYVSNQLIGLENNYQAIWYTPRLTEDEWEGIYGTSTSEDDREKSDPLHTNQIEKGYDLHIKDEERKEAEYDCKYIESLLLGIYEQADKGKVSNIIFSDDSILDIQGELSEIGNPVRTTILYSDMENYEIMDDFLKECMNGETGSIITYIVRSSGGIGREKYIYDGEDMYVFVVNTAWNEEQQLQITYTTFTRIKSWNYTDKGWFCYKLCVSEPPEVSELVDGSCLIRVLPMPDEYRELAKEIVLPVGYMGNNILCSNWDCNHMEELDYNGMYQYLYEMEYQTAFPSELYRNGIPKDEFESVIIKYFPITKEELQAYAVYQEDTQRYEWIQLGCFSYAPNFFSTSLPDVTGIKENEDGTVTITIDAVCEMMLCEDAVITHELTIRFAKDGSFEYLGNHILNDGIRKIPNYQYRIRK